MRHEHLVVTVDSGIKERIDADLDAGESLEAWVADAIERKLDRKAARSDSADSDAEPADGIGPGAADADAESADIIDLGAADSDSSESANFDDSGGDSTESGGETDDDEYDEGFEYVDDCGI